MSYRSISFISSIFFIFIICRAFSGDHYKSVTSVENSDTYNINSLTVTGSEVSIYARTHYDVQSNGVIHYIIQEPGNPQNISAIFLTAQDPIPWNTRNVRYFYSTDFGASWRFVDNVAGVRTSFPSLSLTSDSRAVIMAMNSEGGGIGRSQFYVDSASGFGRWRRLDPGPGFDSGDVWPIVTVSSNNKALWVASVNKLTYDSVDYNVCTNLNSPGTFLGYRNLPNAIIAENYAVATGTGVWGIAFNARDGGAYIIQSTNEGVTWGAPLSIWTWHNYDSVGAVRSIDLMYEGAIPRVFVGLGHIVPGTYNYNIRSFSKQIFWAPDVNGGAPEAVDSAGGLNVQNINDAFFSCCRGVLGKSADGGNIYAAYNLTSGIQDAGGNDYFDVWFRYSTDHGASWSPKTKLTNLSGPLYDYRYVSISPSNDGSNAYILVQKDSIAASSVNGATDSEAKMWLLKVSGIPLGFSRAGNQTPANYSLRQNFPNPFNPSTKINFNIPKNNFVTLKVYDVTGRVVGNLVNQNLSAGKFEYEWDAGNLPSGIYFYTLRAGDFTQTKKMVLVK